MTERAQDNLTQPKLNPVEKILAWLSSKAMDRYGVEKATWYMTKRGRTLPRWYVRALVTKPWSPMFARRKEIGLAEKIVLVKRGWSASLWASQPTLRPSEWQYLIGLVTGEHEADLTDRGRISSTLARRLDLTWPKLRRILESENVSDGEKVHLIGDILYAKGVAWLWREGGELLRWIMDQEGRRRYLVHFTGSGYKLTGMAKRLIDSENSPLATELMEDLIRLNPAAMLEGLAYDNTERKRRASQGADYQDPWPDMTMEYFKGADRQIFVPWLTDPHISRDMRIKAVQWIVDFERMEARIKEENQTGTKNITKLDTAITPTKPDRPSDKRETKRLV